MLRANQPQEQYRSPSLGTVGSYYYPGMPGSSYEAKADHDGLL